MASKQEKIIECMKEISENICSGLFNIDDETMDELLECGAREFEIDELEVALDEAIKWMKWDYILRAGEGRSKEIEKLRLDLSRYKKGYESVMAYYNRLHHDDRIELDKRLKKFDL